MANQPTFNVNWILEALLDVESGATAALIVESTDPTRLSQVRGVLTGRYSDNVYQYDPWKGLMKAAITGGRLQFEPVRESSGSEYDPSLTRGVQEIKDALRYMDPILSSTKCAFIIHGVDRNHNGNDQNADLMNALCSWALTPGIIARRSVVVLFAGDANAAVDANTLAKASLVRPALATDEDRATMVQLTCQAHARLTANDKQGLTIATAGLNMHQTQSVLLKTYHAEQSFNPETVKRYKADYIRRSDVIEIEEPRLGFEDIGGYEAVKEMVRRDFIAAIRDHERANLAAVDLPRGLLLFGPPGTGKTLFAKALARETNLPFINLKTENLFRPWLGESGQRVQNAINLAEQASPAIVFIDEIDRFGKRGGGVKMEPRRRRIGSSVKSSSGRATRRGNQSLSELQMYREHLMPRLCELGDSVISCPFLYPNEAARIQILKSHLGLRGHRRKPAMNEESVRNVLPQIVAETNLYSGSDLEELVTRGKRHFFQGTAPLMMGSDLLAAHKDFSVSMADRQRIEEGYKTLGADFANSLRLLEQATSRGSTPNGH